MVITVIPSTIIHLFFNSSPLLYDFLSIGQFYHIQEFFAFFFQFFLLIYFTSKYLIVLQVFQRYLLLHTLVVH
ncbi:hypothetical protein D4V46_14785, partial [Listeria monocytogenes]|nr:hypothetical protein [Listeria monocytogenes]